MLSTFIDALPSAEADAVCPAGWGQSSSPERVTRRNGYRHRDLDTRVGTIEHHAGAEGRRYLGLEALARARLALVPDEDEVSDPPLALTA